MSSETNSTISEVKDTAMKVIDWILDLPDRPSSALGKKLVYIIFDLGIVLLAYLMLCTMTGSTSFTGIAHAFADPGITTLLSMPMVLGGAGAGIFFLLQDILPKKAHKAVAKVATVVAPLLLFVAGFALIRAGGGHLVNGGGGTNFFHFSLAAAATSPTFYMGLMIIPLGFVAAGELTVDRQKHIPFVRRINRAPRWRDRLGSQQLELNNQTRRNHEQYRDPNMIEMEQIN